MALWFLRGLRRGVVTTRYPRPGWESGDRWTAALPSPPVFRTGLLTETGARRSADACPSGALRYEDGTLTMDLGACTGCGRCLDGAGATGGALEPSGCFELATRDRARLLHRIPVTAGATGETDVTGAGGGTPTEAEEAALLLRRRALALFGRSLHVRTVDTGSCAVCESEIRLLSAPHYDLHRLGLFFTPAPRHADLLLVTGPAVRAADQLLRAAYAATPDPKAVVAVGGCALGGIFSEDEVVHGAVDRVVPVDVYVPGCPPSPLALLQGLLVAVGRLEEQVVSLRRNGSPP